MRYRATTSLIGLTLLAGALLTAAPSRAGTVSGHAINGTLTFCSLAGGGNNFTPASGTAPMEFDYADSGNIDTAVFSATQLTVQDQVIDNACGWGMTFTDTTAPFTFLALASSNFSPDFVFDLTGGTISIGWTGAPGPQTFSAVFDLTDLTDLPEPKSLMVLGVGLVGIGMIRRRPAN